MSFIHTSTLKIDPSLLEIVNQILKKKYMIDTSSQIMPKLQSFITIKEKSKMIQDGNKWESEMFYKFLESADQNMNKKTVSPQKWN